LGPFNYGIYSYAIAFVAIFGTIAKLGLDNIVVLNLFYHPEKHAEYMGTAFWLKCSGALVAICTIFAAIRFTDNSSTINTYITIIAFGLIFQSFEVVDFYFQSVVLSKHIAVCKMFLITISSLLKIYFIIINAKLIYFVLMALVDQITLALLYNHIYSKRRPYNFYGFFCSKLAKNMLKDSWPILVSALSVMVYMRIDQIMLKNMIGEREVGLYSVAVKLTEVWYFVPTILTTSIFPALLNAKKHSKALYHRRLQQLYSFFIWSGILVAISVALLADWIVFFLYGPEFKNAGPALSILIWSGIAVGLIVSSARYLVAENLTRYTLERSFLGALLNIFFNLILIPKIGIKGAAYSVVFALFFAGLLYDIFKPKLKRMFVMKLQSVLIWRYIS
jgi:O-antigen/teichoic acid export membrane protein